MEHPAPLRRRHISKTAARNHAIIEFALLVMVMVGQNSQLPGGQRGKSKTAGSLAQDKKKRHTTVKRVFAQR